MSVFAITLLAAALGVDASQWRDAVSVAVAQIHDRLLTADVQTVQAAFSNQLRPQGRSFGMTHRERCAGPSEILLEWRGTSGAGSCERAVIVFFDLRERRGDDCVEQLTHLVVRDQLASFQEARLFADRIVGAIWSKAREETPSTAAWTIEEARGGLERTMRYEEQPEKYPAGGAPQREIKVQLAPTDGSRWCLRIDVRLYRFGQDLESRPSGPH